MQGIPLHIPASQRLIVHKDHGVVLGVRLMGPRVHPARLLARLRAKPSNVIPSVHIQQQYSNRQCFGSAPDSEGVSGSISARQAIMEKEKREKFITEVVSTGLETSTLSYEV
jgi:hypothetical protein